MLNAFVYFWFLKQVEKSNKETNQIQKLCLEVLYHTLKAHGESALIDAQDQGATKISIALLKNPDERVRELGKSKSDAVSKCSCNLSLCHYTSCNYRKNNFYYFIPLLLSSLTS